MTLLPKGFKRIRHYGIFAGSDRQEHLAHARRLLARACRPRSAVADPLAAAASADADEARELVEAPESVASAATVREATSRCPKCAVGTMLAVRRLWPIRNDTAAVAAPGQFADTS